MDKPAVGKHVTTSSKEVRVNDTVDALDRPALLRRALLLARSDITYNRLLRIKHSGYLFCFRQRHLHPRFGINVRVYVIFLMCIAG